MRADLRGADRSAASTHRRRTPTSRRRASRSPGSRAARPRRTAPGRDLRPAGSVDPELQPARSRKRWSIASTSSSSAMPERYAARGPSATSTRSRPARSGTMRTSANPASASKRSRRVSLMRRELEHERAVGFEPGDRVGDDALDRLHARGPARRARRGARSARPPAPDRRSLTRRHRAGSSPRRAGCRGATPAARRTSHRGRRGPEPQPSPCRRCSLVRPRARLRLRRSPTPRRRQARSRARARSRPSPCRGRRP